MRSIGKEFKDFISRGNVIDLAVAVVLGAAFTAVVTAFAQGILMQLVAAIFGKPNFDDLTFTINGADIFYGKFITAVIYFLIVGFAMFLVVKGVNTLQNMRKREVEEGEAEPTERDLLKEIRDALVQRNQP